MADTEVAINGVDGSSSDLNDWTETKSSDGDFDVNHPEGKIAGLENDLAREKDESEKKISELKAEVEELRKGKLDLVNEKDEAKKKIVELEAEIERLRGEKAAMKDEIDGIKKAEMERSEDGRRAVESIAKRALELETEVSRLQHDLITAATAADESTREVAELRREIEVLKGEKARFEEEVSQVKALEKEKEVLDKEVKELAEKCAKLSEKSNESVAQVDDLIKKVIPEASEGENPSGFGRVKVPLPVVGAASGAVLVAVLAVAWIRYSRRN
ncbi:hypothetical protein Dimus_021867 [Dionaea muscipula]